MRVDIELMVNGRAHRLSVEPRHSLLRVLREDLGLTGVKNGCEDGDCGACVVLVDGQPVDSCLMLAVEADGSEVTTIEGLSRDGELSPIQRAFVQAGAVQCGYCTPGMILATKALLERNPDPERGGGQGRPGGPPLPVHRLREDPGRGAAGRGTAGGRGTAAVRGGGRPWVTR